MYSDLAKFMMFIPLWIIFYIISYSFTPLSKEIVDRKSKKFLNVFVSNISIIYALTVVIMTINLKLDETANSINTKHVDNLILVI